MVTIYVTHIYIKWYILYTIPYHIYKMEYIIYHTISGFLGARLHQADGGPPVQPWRGEQHNCNHQL